MRPRLFALPAAIAVAAVLVPAASADRVFHTLHAEVHPVGSAPLRSGFVNDIHTEGVVNGAHEVYHLNGALPRTTFQVTILFYAADPTCCVRADRDPHDDPHDERVGQRECPLHVPGRASVDAPDERDPLGILDRGGRRLRNRLRAARPRLMNSRGRPLSEAAPPLVVRLHP